MIESFWESVNTPDLRQGDFLSDCMVPEFQPEFGRPNSSKVPVKEYDLIVVSQSCDLEQKKLSLASLCPIYPIQKFQEVNKTFQRKGAWESVRKGQREGLHLLSAFENVINNQNSFVVAFKEIYSLPISYLETKAIEMGDRFRLKSPFLEHFSQSFARFFMRVGLPSGIPPFK